MKTRFLLLASGLLLLSACASVPQPLQGDFAQVSPRDSVASAQPGATVRWGGSIIETVPGQDNTCFQLISRPLNNSGRPDSGASDATDGRFIACRAGFYDPAVFAEGREITVIGRIDGYQDTKIGDYDYRLPRVTADVIYLWPEVSEVRTRYPYYDPFWGPYWGPYWGPRWWW
ncbi:hypothetical protein CSC70_09455 [Pseudoxanthomonas kalamensis DSM 18571]|uniref:Slp family lipoprotein n=1 Tax=Pseudoxanthomonas kalamensis TaxID=289483 RepID=UPI00139139C7|nr:Slp family lipoprotein [Pseudoxanthomonas kalamensis]KAF1709908.1 hypothetical protein CSC70_09455 [Pseudoxanthomonas kalamensis DSM 18571]